MRKRLPEFARAWLAAAFCVPIAASRLGNPVRVLRGVFEGAEGMVADFRQQCKVVMALSATGQSFTVEVDFEDLEVLRKPVVNEIAGCVRPLALSRV